MRILIATITAGGGHLAAAAALEEAWKAARPNDVLERIDLLKFFSPLHRKIHSDGYLTLVERAPELWGMVFAKTDNPKVARTLNKWKRALPSNSRQKFERHVKHFKPDVVLCTHYLPLELLGLGATASHRHGRNKKLADETPALPSGPFVVSVITDFEAHALWMDPCVDLYCVAAEETKARLVARGAAAENIVATGIPIAAKFSGKMDPKAVRKHYGLRDDQRVLLVLSGGFGMGPVGKILAELDKVPAEFQTVVVTGRNEELRRDLAAQDRKHPTHILGFASNMHELMAVADLVITKPGGLTSSEALAMGKPLFILNPIPGQEAANSDFLLERGAAGKVNRVEDLPYRIEQLLGSKKLAQMAAAAKGLGRPQAAKTVCDEVIKRSVEELRG
ncbi:MAG TPA: glycosyltransferase [Verrucomicrobiae bacterium]|jgi:processive 1,2-diacylglycerol beta-glucosyltransferase|nr:glycosyltransferase [Verrucomicrobiae bacterium]